MGPTLPGVSIRWLLGNRQRQYSQSEYALRVYHDDLLVGRLWMECQSHAELVNQDSSRTAW